MRIETTMVGGTMPSLNLIFSAATINVVGRWRGVAVAGAGKKRGVPSRPGEVVTGISYKLPDF